MRVPKSSSGTAAVIAALLLAVTASQAKEAGMAREEPTADTESNQTWFQRRYDNSWSYGEKGLTFDPPGSDTDLWIGLRFQTRLDTFDGDLRTVDDLRQNKDSKLELRRGRIKGGGDLLADWLQIYSEYDFTSSTLLDLRLTATWRGWLSFRAGQWKSEFNRERIDSSGKQQFVERSISTYWFTIDRQRGIAGTARFAEGTRADTRLYLEYLSGQGRGGEFSDDSGLWLGRVMWNPSGTQLPYSQSSLKRWEEPVPSIALAIVDGRTPYSRFSSAGGGSLPGLTPGDFDLRQYMVETAYQYRGFGWQQELHYKRLRDRASGATRELVGGYAQLGVFLDEFWPVLPSGLEVVGRFAAVDFNRDVSGSHETEWTLGLNWFFHGHRNKLTADFSLVDIDEPPEDASKNRFRLQWELSL